VLLGSQVRSVVGIGNWISDHHAARQKLKQAEMSMLMTIAAHISMDIRKK
jgi:hypothetical protein